MPYTLDQEIGCAYQSESMNIQIDKYGGQYMNIKTISIKLETNIAYYFQLPYLPLNLKTNNGKYPFYCK